MKNTLRLPNTRSKFKVSRVLDKMLAKIKCKLIESDKRLKLESDLSKFSAEVR